MTTHWKQTFVHLIVAAICCMPVDISAARAEDEVSAGRAAVSADSAAVFSRMSLNSKVIKTLPRGDLVTVSFELEGADGAWCGIIEEGRQTSTGYMQCKYLEQREVPKTIWRPLGLPAAGTDSNSTKVTIAGRQVLVPVQLEYRHNTVEALLLLDTGASMSLINAETAEKLGINPAETMMAAGQVVGGGIIDIHLARLDHIKVGPHTRPGIRIGVVAHEGPPVRFDGLLGMDFLHDKKYTIDFENQTLHWK